MGICHVIQNNPGHTYVAYLSPSARKSPIFSFRCLSLKNSIRTDLNGSYLTSHATCRINLNLKVINKSFLSEAVMSIDHENHRDHDAHGIKTIKCNHYQNEPANCMPQ